MTRHIAVLGLVVAFCVCVLPNNADTVVVNTGSPVGQIATASRPSNFGDLEIETVDGFVLSQGTSNYGTVLYRPSNLDPDWSRVGTDITNQGPFNASFRLEGNVPEPWHDRVDGRWFPWART